MSSLRKARIVAWVSMTCFFCLVLGMCSFLWDRSMHSLPVLVGAALLAAIISGKERSRDIYEWADRKQFATTEQQARQAVNDGLPDAQCRARFDALIAPLSVRDRIIIRIKLFPNDRRETLKGKIDVLQALLDAERDTQKGHSLWDESAERHVRRLRAQLFDLQTELAALESMRSEGEEKP